jgi:hypothetical protein
MAFLRTFAKSVANPLIRACPSVLEERTKQECQDPDEDDASVGPHKSVDDKFSWGI